MSTLLETNMFYTRKGDKGRSYVGKKSISKTCLEVEALGQLDELNSMIGVVKNLKKSEIWRAPLHGVQENLFIIQSHVANLMLGGGFKTPRFNSAKVKETEKIIDGIERKLPPLKKFVIPGANLTSAWLDLLRAKSRNVERGVLKVLETRKPNISNISNISDNLDIKSYLNRLSSLFFALARWEARGKKEKNPEYK